MTEDESRRSLTAYIIVAIAITGLTVAFMGVTMGLRNTAIIGWIMMFVALIAYQVRPKHFE